MNSNGPSAQAPATELIRCFNRTWWLLYYDDLIDAEYYQLTLVDEPNIDGYYNCANAVRRSDRETIDRIEAFYADYSLPSAVFLDPESPADLETILRSRGYQSVADEREDWFTIELAAGWDRNRTPASWLRIEPARVAIDTVRPGDPAFEEFLHVDVAANELPSALGRRLQTYPRERRHHDAYSIFLLARVDGRPAACSAVGVCAGNAYLAEGGTLTDYRRLGLFSALLQRRLEIATDAGCRFVAAAASPSAHSGPALAQLGFSKAWTRTYMRKELR